MKSSRMRWAGHVTRTGKMRNSYKVSFGKPEGKRPLGRVEEDGRIILKWILRKEAAKMRTEFNWLKIKWRAHVNTVMGSRVLQKAGNFFASRAPRGSSRGILSYAV
jgi:hypothetical protein